MKYEGKLYARIAKKYIELEADTTYISNMISTMNQLYKLAQHEHDMASCEDENPCNVCIELQRLKLQIEKYKAM